jgi:FkbM family methyltransferase
MKRILIGIPTAKYIEPETFKSIYDLEIPNDCVIDFQFFYGYNIDQVRNLIAHWAISYDYLFSVDSDIAFPKDTLKKLLNHNKDIVSGLYKQRKEDVQILEVYEKNNLGGSSNIPYEKIKDTPFLEIESCGFGCVLVKSEVFKKVGYPYFVYHSAIDHRNTISEDVDFCRKAKKLGFKIYADTTILCDHIGNKNFKISNSIPSTPKSTKSVTDSLRELSEKQLIRQEHYEYLKGLNINPKNIYDIGACVLHWTKMAKYIWPNANYIAFEAMNESEPIFIENNVEYYLNVLSKEDGKKIKFYQNTKDPGGNSYYKENEKINPKAKELYKDFVLKTTKKLDTLVKEKKIVNPDLIKIDVQGSELDILKGGMKTIKKCKHLIIETQEVDYNVGGSKKEEVFTYLKENNFKFVCEISNNGPDADYHFINLN